MRHRVTIGRRAFAYLEATGRPVPQAQLSRTAVLIHAFPLNAEMWMPQLESVPPGWRFIAPDLAGFGDTDSRRRPAGESLHAAADSDASIDDYAGDLIDLLDHLHIDEAVIGGLSMGGYVTFAMFRLAPRYFTGLILADTRSQADSEDVRSARRKMLDVVARKGPEAVADEMLPKLLSAETHHHQPAVVSRVRDLITRNTPDAIAMALTSMMGRPDSTPLLKAIHRPTLIIVGEEDGVATVSDSESMQRQIPGSILERIPRAGHLSNLEQPAAFNAAVGSFLVRRL